MQETADSRAGTLASCASGGEVVVAEVTGGAGVRRRLLEMGLTPGVAVRVLRRAPLGDPLELRVRGYLLSLRLAEAACVQVR